MKTTFPKLFFQYITVAICNNTDGMTDFHVDEAARCSTPLQIARFECQARLITLTYSVDQILQAADKMVRQRLHAKMRCGTCP